MEKVKKIVIDTARCKGCRLCIMFCPKRSLKVSDELNKLGVFPVIFDHGKNCDSCGFCYLVCPELCIEVYR